MAHVVRPERPARNGHRHDHAGEVTIDLRHGDLSDDEVVAVLLQLARDRAGSDAADRTRREIDRWRTVGTDPARPRRRTVPAQTTLAVVGAFAVVLVGVLIVLGVRSTQDIAAAPRPAGASGDGSGPAAPVTSSPVTSTTVRTPPSTTRPAPTTPPSTVPTPVTTAASAAGVAADPTTSFCRAVSVYTLDNLITLAENGVRDPQGTLAAFGTMVANAPPELVDDVGALGPVTGKVQVEIEAGRITTPEQLQQFLAGGAPTDEVGRWIVAQQAIVAELPRLCPDRPTP